MATEQIRFSISFQSGVVGSQGGRKVWEERQSSCQSLFITGTFQKNKQAHNFKLKYKHALLDPDSSGRPHPPPPPAPPALSSPSNVGFNYRHSVNSFSSATGSVNNLDPDAFTFATVTTDGCTGRGRTSITVVKIWQSRELIWQLLLAHTPTDTLGICAENTQIISY